MASWNDQIIEEFRANDGRGGGPFAGTPMLLLTTHGRSSGQPRTSPVVYSTDGSRYVVAASNGGSDSHPQWFLNLQADPHTTIEVGDRTLAVHASIASGAERNRLYAAHAAMAPGFAAYEEATTRVIPVVVLEPTP